MKSKQLIDIIYINQVLKHSVVFWGQLIKLSSQDKTNGSIVQKLLHIDRFAYELFIFDFQNYKCSADIKGQVS